MPASGPFAKLRVAAVLDEFTAACLQPEVELLNLHGRWWLPQLVAFRPDVLFVESTWHGRAHSWKGKIVAPPGKPKTDDTLRWIIRYCRARAIPTVFWNKEDPVHFDRFIESARLFDYVFTTDEGKLEAYQRECKLPPSRVGTLQFAAQPRMHHPLNGSWDDVVCFAGSYGEAEFPERRREIEMLLDAAAGFDLRILDRRAAIGIGDTFPARFSKFVAPGVDYRELARLQRAYKVFLNVNSIRDSRTMFSRRIYEVLASGSSCVSGPGIGVTATFGDLVPVVDDARTARSAIQRLLTDEDYRLSHALRGIRLVHTRHRYEDRLAELVRAIGWTPPPRRAPAALTVVRSLRDVDQLTRVLAAQELPPSEVVVVAYDVAAAGSWKVIAAGPHEDELAAVRRAAGSIASPQVACVALQHQLGPALISSLAITTGFAEADLVGKVPRRGATRVVHRQVDRVHPHAILVSRDRLAGLGWSTRDQDIATLDDIYRPLRKVATDDEGFTPHS